MVAENSHHHHNVLLLREVVDIKANSGQCDYSLVAPIRQTASIFKQPVTVFKEHKSKVSLRILVNFLKVVLNDVTLFTQTFPYHIKVKAELKAVSREKPSQLFWTRCCKTCKIPLLITMMLVFTLILAGG